MSTIETKDWVMVFATVLGPILAVQAQKYLERARESKTRKTAVFQTLMATRANRLSTEHVRALNLIDIGRVDNYANKIKAEAR